MRLCSALLLSLLCAVSTAAAEPAASTQGVPAPHDQRARAARDAVRGPAQDPNEAEPSRSKSTSYPSYFNDPRSESTCYYVFGDLRCARVPNRPQGTAQR